MYLYSLTVQLIAPQVIMSCFSQAAPILFEAAPQISEGFKKIDKWLNEQTSTRVEEILARAIEYWKQNSVILSKDENLAWWQFTKLAQITPETRCKRDTTDAFATSAHESGFEWYKQGAQELKVQKFIEEIANSNAKICLPEINEEIKSKVLPLEGFKFLWALVSGFDSEYGVNSLIFAPDSKYVVPLFQIIRSGEPESKFSSGEFKNVSPALPIIRAIKNMPPKKGFRQLIETDLKTEKILPANVKQAVNYIFSKCRDYINDQAVQELIPPVETYIKFHYNSMFLYPTESYQAWSNFKFCENFLGRDEDKISREVIMYLENGDVKYEDI